MRLSYSTARYFAKQAYQLRLMTGREQVSTKTKEGWQLELRWHPTEIAVIDIATETCRSVPIAKDWRNL